MRTTSVDSASPSGPDFGCGYDVTASRVWLQTSTNFFRAAAKLDEKHRSPALDTAVFSPFGRASLSPRTPWKKTIFRLAWALATSAFAHRVRLRKSYKFRAIRIRALKAHLASCAHCDACKSSQPTRRSFNEVRAKPAQGRVRRNRDRIRSDRRP